MSAAGRHPGNPVEALVLAVGSGTIQEDGSLRQPKIKARKPGLARENFEQRDRDPRWVGQELGGQGKS